MSSSAKEDLMSVSRFSRLFTRTAGFLTFLLIPACTPSEHITAARMRRASPRVAHAYDYQDLHLVRGGTNQ
jgi:hypothetical protein